MRRMPDGTVSRVSEEECMDAWRALAEPLERAFGWKLCAWDPGYMFEAPGGYTIELAVNEVRSIVAIIERCADAEHERDELKAELGAEHASWLNDQDEIAALGAVAEKRPTAAAYVRGLRASVQRLASERDEALLCARVEADNFDEARSALRETVRVAETIASACEQGAGGTVAERVRQAVRPAKSALASLGGRSEKPRDRPASLEHKP